MNMYHLFQSKFEKLLAWVRIQEYWRPQKNKLERVGSGCDTVGSTVDSDTRGPGFESSHRQLLLNNYLLLTVF